MKGLASGPSQKVEILTEVLALDHLVTSIERLGFLVSLAMKECVGVIFGSVMIIVLLVGRLVQMADTCRLWNLEVPQ